MTVESTIARAKVELANGRLWRAKEILSSSLSTYGYAPKIYSAYANLLLESGDDLKAGMFFLLTVEKPDEAQRTVIDLFLKRHQYESWKQLISSFPKPAQIDKRDDYPAFLRAHLISKDAPEALSPRPLAPSASNRSRILMLRAGCFLAAAAAVVCALVGAVTILLWCFAPN